MNRLVVEESLRNWCRESLAFARERFSLADRGQAIRNAECAVDRAAFQQLLNGRGISVIAGFDSSADQSPLAIDVVNSIVDTCPMDAATSPDVLGFIHENLVALRGSRQSVTAPRRSLSRKVNGIFYTPAFIVNEIVHQTIGPRLPNAFREKRDRIRILDPAAGCGAFLVAAYRYLIQRSLDDWKSSPDQSLAFDVVLTDKGWKLPFRRCQSILTDHLFGVDLDPASIEVTRRMLWLTLIDSAARETIPNPIDFLFHDLAANFKSGHALIGSSFDVDETKDHVPSSTSSLRQRFDWETSFPQVAVQGGFDVVIGNPPYRRERDFKPELDEIKSTPFGQKHHSARMDLWYYFLHRGIQLLRTGGSLSYITNAYWMQGRGAEKVIAALRDEVHLDELFLLGGHPVFPSVSGQHVIFRVTKSGQDAPTTIKIVPREITSSISGYLTGEAKVLTLVKTRQELFREGRLNVLPSADPLFQKLRSHPRLVEFGLIRQGIAENPAAINRRTRDRFHKDSLSHRWLPGEGVFSLQASEVARLALTPTEAKLLRPYHDLCDLQRYWAASQPSRHLIYSTRQTWPEMTDFPILCRHLSRFRAVLDARRETRQGNNSWWHLHWPRDDRIWQTDKLVALQLAARPSFVPLFGPAYVPFSANVFIPSASAREDLYYFCGLLNSRVLWVWFSHSAKRRGIGLELNGHTLEDAPIRRIDFDNPDAVYQHDELVRSVRRRIELATLSADKTPDESNGKAIDDQILEIESRLDAIVASLYGLSPEDTETINEIVSRERC